jgi:hypothetical protein
MKTPIGIAMLVLVPVLAGCGGTTLDDKSLEEALPHDLRPAVSEPIKSASCPSGIDVEKGKEFSCVITLESGKKETVRLRLTDAKADYEFLSLSPNK